MAKSKNGPAELSKLEDPIHPSQSSGQSSKEPRASAVPRDSKEPLKQGSRKNPKEPSQKVPVLGRPRKQSRRGQGGGPKTAAGKAKASRNAIKHGIMSKSPVIPGMEEEEEWHAHRAAAVESLEPDGHLETVLAERIAFLFWRFLRVVRYETAVTAKGVEFEGVDTPDAEMWLLPTSFHLDRIMRYDGNIQRQLVQTYNLFEAVQARRQGQPVNHTRVDISSSPQFRNTRAPALADAFASLT